jgi:hypothetical protein
MITLDRSIPFVRLALDAAPEQAVEVLRAAEQRHGLRWLASAVNLPENQQAEWYEQHLWPFLSETHFVLAGGDLFATGCSLLDSTGIDHTPTWSHWGQIVADWANRYWIPRPEGLGRTNWSRARRRWEYPDFSNHAGLSYLIDGYDTWRAAVWRVLALSGVGHVPVVPDAPRDRPFA